MPYPRFPYTIIVAILSCILLLDNTTIAAQENESPQTSEQTQEEPPVSDGQNTPDEVNLERAGYHPDGRRIGTPIDVERDLDFSFPKRDYILPRVIPKKYFQWKEDLYEDYGVKLGFSYQTLYQNASDTQTGEDVAAAGWLLVEGKWEIFNRNEDFEGSVVATFDWRHTLGGAEAPAFWGVLDVGSQWPTDLGYIEWDPWVPVAFWEQWFTKDRFVLRVGQQNVAQIYDFSRFKDVRVAFSSTPLNVAVTAQPFPGPGLGTSFQFWPIADSTLYVIGTINDMNFEIERWRWGQALSERDFFYGLEVGHNWVRGPGDFDHLHINLFYATRPEDNPLPLFPSESGWGFKVSGEKQMGRFVGFGSYTYNDSEGGAFGVTLAKHMTTAGFAVLKPFGLRGEIGVGTSFSQPRLDNLDSQYGVETYWKVLVLPSLWVTPGVQVIFDPTFNGSEDSITIGQIKARLFF